MKIFLDSADITLIKKYSAWGVIDGVTTNPTIIMKEGANFETRIKEICAVIDGPVSAEVISTDASEMIAEGKKLAAWAANIVVKIPMIPAGLEAVSILSAEGIHTNMTLIFSPAQALLAAKAGATFVSPFVGRIDDIGNDAIHELQNITDIFKRSHFKTEVLAASIRTHGQFLDAVKAGADIATIPPLLLEKMVAHPLTNAGLAQFLADWASIK